MTTSLVSARMSRMGAFRWAVGFFLSAARSYASVILQLCFTFTSLQHLRSTALHPSHLTSPPLTSSSTASSLPPARSNPQLFWIIIVTLATSHHLTTLPPCLPYPPKPTYSKPTPPTSFLPYSRPSLILSHNPLLILHTQGEKNTLLTPLC